MEPLQSYTSLQDNDYLWRYMDFEKFVSILSRKALFFSRVDKLGDPFEGSISLIDKKLENQESESTQHKIMQTHEIPAEVKSSLVSAIANKRVLSSKWLNMMRKCRAVSCWHKNENESTAMWKQYGTKGIAIQTTYKNLKDCFIENSGIEIKPIRYIDYGNSSTGYTRKVEDIYIKNDLTPILHKQLCFKYENEVRAYITKEPKSVSPEGVIDYSQCTIEDGLYVAVDVHTLIQKIYIAPYSPLWFKDLIEDIVRQYNYKDIFVTMSQQILTPDF